MKFKGEQLRDGKSPIIDSAQFSEAVVESRNNTTTVNKAQVSVTANRKQTYNGLLNQMIR